MKRSSVSFTMTSFIFLISFLVFSGSRVAQAADPTVAFNLASSSGAESTTPASMAVSLSAASAVDVTVQYTIVSLAGTATGSSTDYTLADGTLTFTAGETTKNISAVIVDDALVENDETIVVLLFQPSNGTLGINIAHTYTIVDDDPTL